MSSPDMAFAERSADLLAHPEFGEARRLMVDSYLALYSGKPALNKLLVDGSKHVIIMFAICLAAHQREDDPTTWLTIAKLQEVVTAYQVGSPGLVESIVARMIDSGLMEARPSPSDRRKKLLKPTEALIAHDLDMLAALAVPCVAFGSHPAYDLAIMRSREMQWAHRTVSVAAFGEALQTLMRHPQMMMIFHRDSGYMVLLSLLQSALASPSGTISTVSYQAIADRFGVSRSHVRNLVEDAEQAGLMRVDAQGGAGVELLPRLMAVHDCYFADCMVLIERRFHEAYGQLRDNSLRSKGNVGG